MRDGGAEIRRFGRGRKRVIFLLYPMSQYEHFGPPEAPGPFEGFSGPPSQGPTEGSRGRAEGPDRQSDAVARDPSKGDSASSVRRCRRPGTRSFERRRDSSGSSSRPARRRTTKLSFETSPARASRLGIRSSKPTTVKKSIYEFLRSNQNPDATSERRPRTRDL